MLQSVTGRFFYPVTLGSIENTIPDTILLQCYSYFYILYIARVKGGCSNRYPCVYITSPNPFLTCNTVTFSLRLMIPTHRTVTGLENDL